jgi:ElaA protein
MNLKLEWNLKKFEELEVEELYELLRLRSEVFVVEQQSIFLDADNKDQQSWHLLGKRNGELLAYSRIVPKEIAYEYAAIGRIVLSAQARNQGLGKELMRVSIDKVESLYGKVIIRIGAQLYLEKFYNSFGFVRSSPAYDEDGIMHIEMTREVVKTVEF